MADAEMLKRVKSALGITGDFMNDTISVYIDEVVEYMTTAGVSGVNIAASPGVVSRGVSDLWNNNSGAGKLSPYFYDRVAQLVYKTRADVDKGGGG